MTQIFNDINILLPEIFLSIVACGLILIGAFSKCVKYGYLLLTSSFSMAIYFLLFKTPNVNTLAFYNLFKMNDLIKLEKLILLISALFFSIFYSRRQNNGCSIIRTDLYEFSVLIILSITGMLLMLSANNFLSLYLSLELQSFCLYVLVSFEREDSKSSEAGLKYFILGSFASGLLLFGISLIYGFTGNVDFDQLQMLLSQHHSNNIAIAIIIGLIMVLIGMFFKISAAPFHMWSPDVYQGSPTIVTSFIATVAKVASIGILIRFSYNTLSVWKSDLQPIFILITSASLLIGAIGALKQTNIKRLLSYSSIGHVGFMLLAISSLKEYLSVILYLSIYVSMTLGTFALIMNIKANGKDITNINDLAGLVKSDPILASCFAVFMFSLAGIPPFAGFFAKLYVFKTALAAELYIPIAIAIISAVISAYYYLRIIKIIYLDQVTHTFTNEMTYSSRVFLLALVLFNLCYILFAY